MNRAARHEGIHVEVNTRKRLALILSGRPRHRSNDRRTGGPTARWTSGDNLRTHRRPGFDEHSRPVNALCEQGATTRSETRGQNNSLIFQDIECDLTVKVTRREKGDRGTEPPTAPSSPSLFRISLKDLLLPMHPFTAPPVRTRNPQDDCRCPHAVARSTRHRPHGHGPESSSSQ
jgi:hypothetical protein